MLHGASIIVIVVVVVVTVTVICTHDDMPFRSCQLHLQCDRSERMMHLAHTDERIDAGCMIALL